LPPEQPTPEAPARFDSRTAGRLGGMLVVLWIPTGILLSSLLLVQHLVTLPKPKIDAPLRQSLDSTLPLHRGAWFVLHVLAENCQCSQDVLSHLLSRGPESFLSEKVLFIGKQEPTRSRLLERGFAFESITPEELQMRYRIEGAPVMLVVNRQGEVAYSGGYSATNRGALQDLAIFRALALGTKVKPLPLFGCAVSRELQQRLDPLGLKYTGAGIRVP
jgi:hypothetical protein